MRRPRSTPLVLLALLVLLATACGDDSGDEASTAPASTPTAARLQGELTIFAAASLTGSFDAIVAAFTEANPDVAIQTPNYASSSALVAQINEGAPADIYAAADQANMQKLTDAANADAEPQVFATNDLQIITEPGNPKAIRGVADLVDPDLIVVTCAPEVPVGAYAAQVFEKAGVTVTPKSFEPDVKAVVNKVTAGEADAGIVYATDVQAAGAAGVGVAIPASLNVIATYPIAVTKAADDPWLAHAFVDFVLGAEGQAILAASGFGGP